MMERALERVAAALMDTAALSKAPQTAPGGAILRDIVASLERAHEGLQEYVETDGQGSPERQPYEISEQTALPGSILARIGAANDRGEQPQQWEVIGRSRYRRSVIWRMIRCGWVRDLSEGTGSSLVLTTHGREALEEYRKLGVAVELVPYGR